MQEYSSTVDFDQEVAMTATEGAAAETADSEAQAECLFLGARNVSQIVDETSTYSQTTVHALEDLDSTKAQQTFADLISRGVSTVHVNSSLIGGPTEELAAKLNSVRDMYRGKVNGGDFKFVLDGVEAKKADAIAAQLDGGDKKEVTRTPDEMRHEQLEAVEA